MVFILLLALLISPLCSQAQGTLACNQQVTHESLLEQMTFDDAIYILTHMKFCELHTKKDRQIKWCMLIEATMNESKTICKRNKIKNSEVIDFLKIALYRFIYEKALSSITMHSENMQEILLLKNVLRPGTFQIKDHTFPIDDYYLIDYNDFPLAVQEKIVSLTKHLTIEESVAWLLAHDLRIQQKSTVHADNIMKTLWSSVEGALALYQKMRSIIEQQEQPEHRALSRLLFTDQEIINLFTISAFNNHQL